MSGFTHITTSLRCEECPLAAWRTKDGKPEAVCRAAGHRESPGGLASPEWCPLRKGAVIVRAYP